MPSKSVCTAGALPALVLALVLIAIARPPLEGQTTPTDVMEGESRRLTGEKGIDCGRVRLRGDPKTATKCALKAQTEGKPFRVRYDLQGIDSAVAGGIVRTPDGTVYALFFDGNPAGWGGTSPTLQRVSKKECPKPIHLWVNPSGRINCFQQKSSPPGDVMSPNIEPY